MSGIPGLITTIASAISDAIPAIANAIRNGKDPADVRLGDFVSTDALDKVRAAATKAEDFIENG